MNYTQLITEAQEHQMGKVCNKCNKHLPLSEFSIHRSSPDGLRYECKSCAREYQVNICPFKKWFIRKKHNAKRKGIEFTIEPTDIAGVKIRKSTDSGAGSRTSWEATQYPKVCSKWYIELNWQMNKKQWQGPDWNSPSLDRIDPTKGYIPGNVRLVCNSYNMAKSNCPPDVWDVVEKQIGRAILFGDNNG